MSKEIFKVGDKVYHIEYGWGVVKLINYSFNFPFLVEFNKENIVTFTNDGKGLEDSLNPILSFTEYTLQGFTQERPIELPDVGELCLVRDNEDENWRVREFEFEDAGMFYVKSLCGSTDGYDYMKRIKILD